MHSYKILGENNRIVLFDDNGFEIDLNKNISGLTISIDGNNNLVRIHAKTVFIDSYIQIGNDNVCIEIDHSDFLSMYLRCCFRDGQKFKLGKNTEIGGACFYLDEETACFIGKGCMFSNDIKVWGSDGHAVLDKNTGEFINEVQSPIEIGNHCWIGQGCRILKGSGLADDSVLGGGAVLTKKFLEQNVALGGNPAKVIKKQIVWNKKSIYILKKEKGKYKKMSENLKYERVMPAFNNIEKTVAIAFSSSNYYVPYLSVVLSSLVNHCSSDKNYDIIVFTQDINVYNQETLKNLVKQKNVSLRFFNVSDFFNNKNIYVPQHVTSLTIETYYRLLAPMIFSAYPKVIFCDSDTLILDDVAKLYDMDIAQHPLAATRELLFQSAFIEAGRNIPEFLATLGLNNPEKYFQAGVVLFNNNYFNQNNLSLKLLDNIQNNTYEMVDQDALNQICQEKALLISNRWNYVPLSEKYKSALKFMPEKDKQEYFSVKEPGIIHFIGAYWKPWCVVENKYDHIWWSYCRKTPYYEEALRRLCEYGISKKIKDIEALHNDAVLVNGLVSEDVFEVIRNIYNLGKNKIRYLKYSFIKNFSWGKKRKKYKEKRRKIKNEIKQAKRILKSR